VRGVAPVNSLGGPSFHFRQLKERPGGKNAQEEGGVQGKGVIELWEAAFIMPKKVAYLVSLRFPKRSKRNQSLGK